MSNSFLRTWLTVLGIGMVVLWIAGLSSPVESRWMTWLDLVAAALTFVGVAFTTPATARNTRVSGTIALASGLFGLWVNGLIHHAVPWLTWWNFLFACAYLVVGIAASRGDVSASGERTVPFRRSA
jgi:hypothetical protein